MIIAGAAVPAQPWQVGQGVTAKVLLAKADDAKKATQKELIEKLVEAVEKYENAAKVVANGNWPEKDIMGKSPENIRKALRNVREPRPNRELSAWKRGQDEDGRLGAFRIMQMRDELIGQAMGGTKEFTRHGRWAMSEGHNIDAYDAGTVERQDGCFTKHVVWKLDGRTIGDVLEGRGDVDEVVPGALKDIDNRVNRIITDGEKHFKSYTWYDLKNLLAVKRSNW